MTTGISENLREVAQILNQHAVEYLAIGGAAVALHGYERWSTTSSGKESKVIDLDFWYNPVLGNYFKLLDALEKIGHDVSRIREEKTVDPQRSFFRIDRPNYTLDFLPQIPGLPRFREVYATKEVKNLHSVDIPFISLDYLIQNKQTLNRPKDQEDIRQLKQKREARHRRPGQRPH